MSQHTIVQQNSTTHNQAQHVIYSTQQNTTHSTAQLGHHKGPSKPVTKHVAILWLEITT